MARTLPIAAALALVAAALVLLPVEVPHSVSVAGKLYPAQEWMLVRDDNGSLGSILRDHARGSVQSYSVNHFERGDAVRVSFQPTQPLSRISIGDTIGEIHSNETQRQLAVLTGNLASVMSALDLHASGEKASVVEQARMRVQRFREEARQQQIEVERLRQLHEKNHVSAQEVELAATRLQVLNAEVGIALAELETAQTGAKPQQIELTRTEAEALRNEIEMLQDRLSMYTITSPISGVAVRSFGSDTLLTVRDTAAFVVVMPVPWKLYPYLERDQRVEVKMPGLTGGVTGQLQQFGDEVHMLNTQPVVMATAFITDPDPGLMPGAMAECTISTGKVSLLEYLRRLLA